MTLLQMQYFKAICQFGSITRAANYLFVTRPAVSRVLKGLEEELGVSLFYRSTNGLALTEEGKIFYDSCMDILNRVETLEKRMQKFQAKNSDNNIIVGLTPATGVLIFPTFYKRFCEAHPEIKLSVVEFNNVRAREMLSEGYMDAIFTSDIDWDNEKCESYPLFTTELVFCVSKDHPLAGKKSVTVEDIANERFIYLDKNMQRENEVLDRYIAKGLLPRIILRTTQVEVIKQIVGGCLACTVQIKGTVDDGKNIIGIPFEPNIPIKIGIKWNIASEINESFNTFLDYVKNFDFSPFGAEKVLNK